LGGCRTNTWSKLTALGALLTVARPNGAMAWTSMMVTDRCGILRVIHGQAARRNRNHSQPSPQSSPPPASTKSSGDAFNSIKCSSPSFTNDTTWDLDGTLPACMLTSNTDVKDCSGMNFHVSSAFKLARVLNTFYRYDNMW
jgi:hypothetical protein